MTSRTQQRNIRPILQGALLVLLLLVAYYPALRGEFLWDDDDNVTKNAALRSLEGLRRIWFEPGATQQYYPLTHTTFWLDYHLWGLNPLPYHAENILLHAISALLLWRILKWLDLKGAWLGAALFALHPTCVESVAWITERKNTLSGVFFLGAIMAGLRYWLPKPVSSPSQPKSRSQMLPVFDSGPGKFYWLALLMYLCALWSKTATVALPVVMLLLLWWQRGKIGWRDFARLIPFISVGIAMGGMTMWVERHHLGATGNEWRLSLMQRCLIAALSPCFYLGKLLWPHPLMFIYPRWQVQAWQPLVWPFGGDAAGAQFPASQRLAWLALVVTATLLLVLWRRRNGWRRPVLFTIGYFIALLFPVMGFFNVYFYRYSFVCDHFQYLACIGPLALAAAGIVQGLEYIEKQWSALKPIVCGALVLTLGILTWQQTHVYHDVETLWRDTLAKNPGAWMARVNLGNILGARGNFDEAIREYRAALRIKPDYAEGYYDLGNTLNAEGHVDEAILLYTQALKIDPDYAQAHNNLANTLARKGKVAEAIQHYEKALQVEPAFVDAHYNLANALAGKGSMEEAILHYRRALQIDPDNVLVRNNLANILAEKGNLDEAITLYKQVLKSEPNLADTHYDLGLALAEKGDTDGAIHHYQVALQIRPGFADAHYSMGTALASQGKLEEARQQLVEALRLKPDFTEAQQQLRALSASENKSVPGK